MRQRNSNKRGVEHPLRQSLPGEKSPDRARNTGLQSPALVVGEPILVEDAQPTRVEASFSRFAGNVAFQPQNTTEPTSELL